MVGLVVLVLLVGGGFWAYHEGYFKDIEAKLNRPKTKQTPTKTGGTPTSKTPTKTTPTTTKCDPAAKVCPSNKSLISLNGKCMTPKQYADLNIANMKTHGCKTGQYYNICTKKCVAQPGVKFARAMRVTIA
jgi:hypothetical protein